MYVTFKNEMRCKINCIEANRTSDEIERNIRNPKREHRTN